jgi:Flp pilus assembly pilin Flp
MRRNSPTRSIHDRGYRMQDLTLKLYLAAKFVLDRTEGQSMTEYAMAVGLIAFGCVAGEAAVATSVNHIFETMGTTILNGVIH